MILPTRSGGTLMSDVQVEGATEVLLEAGRYTIRRRAPEAVYETEISMKRGGVQVVTGADLVRVPYGRTIRKGTGLRSYVWSTSAGAEVSAPEAKPAAAHPHCLRVIFMA
jgi:hypothetical protein